MKVKSINRSARIIESEMFKLVLQKLIVDCLGSNVLYQSKIVQSIYKVFKVVKLYSNL